MCWSPPAPGAPKQDVGQAFLRHEVMANEDFLGLVPQDGKTWAKVPREFRWVLGEYLDLPFEDCAAFHIHLERRRLQPDAVLEIPTSGRRFFIEYEMGSATVRDTKKSLDDGQARSLRGLPRCAVPATS